MSKQNEVLCPGKDVFERMNYLFQASQLISKSDPVLASKYGNLMINCGKKAVLRIEPEIKRSICKKCQAPLIAGETAKVRLISKPCKSIKWTCLLCKNTRKIPTKPGYKLWINEPQSIVKIFDYSKQQNDNNKSKNTNIKNESESLNKNLQVEQNEILITNN